MASKLCVLLVTCYLSTTLILAQKPPTDRENPTPNVTQNILNTTSVLPPGTEQKETKSTSGQQENKFSSTTLSQLLQQKTNLKQNRTQNTISTTLPLELIAERKVSTTEIQDVGSTSALPLFTETANDTRNIVDGCPERCKCDVWEKRDGLIVNCSNQNLTSIPKTIPLRTIYVNLRYNLIQNITRTTFSRWNTKTVQKINLARNNLSSVDQDSFKYFNHLWEINFSSNKLKDIKHIKLPIVHELNLDNNQIDFNVTSGFDETIFSTNQNGVCDLIYRRNTKPIDNQWTNLENVKQIMIKRKCPVKLILQVTEPTPTAETTTKPPADEIKNTTEILSSNERQNVPTPAEIVFYSSVLTVFSVLMLFLVSQSYNHAWLRCLRKKVSRRNTRDHIIHVQPQSVRKQSHLQSKDDVGILPKRRRESGRI